MQRKPSMGGPQARGGGLGSLVLVLALAASIGAAGTAVAAADAPLMAAVKACEPDAARFC